MCGSLAIPAASAAADQANGAKANPRVKERREKVGCMGGWMNGTRPARQPFNESGLGFCTIAHRAVKDLRRG
jgi:hypothetical protein